MPTYDYRCRDCGHTIEIVHSILEDGPEACERCRGPLVRVLHPAGVIFKGSGFYTTDSRKSAGSADGAGSGTGESGGSASSASKPGSKTTDSGSSSSGSSSTGGSSTGTPGGKGSADSD